MKTIILSILVILLPTAYGKVGMTKNQCDKLYGESKPNEKRGYTYKQNQMVISTYFTKNICFQISYEQENKFTNEEIKKIIKENCKESYRLKYKGKESQTYVSQSFNIECRPTIIIITNLKMIR
ncbi:MAG: hypothetical protein NE327_20600 [Lentisphaeraceae bacterium]|nr:hypothetical protein [Lentisphaeraceae bacterium]